jgi:threonine/homoserine/homoserine lactone efflux protein
VHSQLLPFIGTAILIALTPGADTALVVRNALVAGAPSARRTALGTSTGLLVWGAASACGVAAVLNASAEVFTAVKLAGGAGIFFTALLPQFVSPDDPALLVSLLMTAIAAATALAWLSVYATVVPRAGDVLRRPPVRRALDRATGVVLIGLGVRLALTRR